MCLGGADLTGWMDDSNCAKQLLTTYKIQDYVTNEGRNEKYKLVNK